MTSPAGPALPRFTSPPLQLVRGEGPDTAPFECLGRRGTGRQLHWTLGGRRLEFGDEVLVLVFGARVVPGFFLPGGGGHNVPAVAFDSGPGWPLSPYFSTVDLGPWTTLRRMRFTRSRTERPPIAPIRNPEERATVLAEMGSLRFCPGDWPVPAVGPDLDRAAWLRLLLADFDRRHPASGWYSTGAGG